MCITLREPCDRLEVGRTGRASVVVVGCGLGVMVVGYVAVACSSEKAYSRRIDGGEKIQKAWASPYVLESACLRQHNGCLALGTRSRSINLKPRSQWH